MSMPMSAPRLDHHHARITEDWALRQLGIPLYELELEGETVSKTRGCWKACT